MLIRLLILALLILANPSFGDVLNVSLYPVPGAPYLQSPELTIDSAEYDTFVLEMDSKQSGTARLFWSIHYDPQFNQQKSIWFSVKPGSHDYYFNIPSQNPNWLGWVNGFVVFPEMGQELVEIKQAKIIKGNLLTTIQSGWQEFWGPRGRLVIGSTINTMQSSNLFGRPIFVYIYWLTGFIILIYLGREIFKWTSQKKSPPLEKIILKTGKAAFITVIIFWGLLEINGLFNNWLQFKGDLQYFGKSYEEKLVIANTGDFYHFIRFCENNIPPESSFDMSIPPFYNDIKARYYLYPRKYEKNAPFLVVYDMAPEEDLSAKYSSWKKFREGAYILKKR